MARSARGDTARNILDAAERLVQTRGFNGFSYADIAAELAVTKASLHYHFPTKAALGRALIARYREAFLGALAAIDAEELDALEALSRYVRLYAAVLSDQRMCLCGMVAAEYATLPKGMQEEIRRFFTANEVWLAQVIEEGAAAGVLSVRSTPLECARLVLSTLEGAMLVARSYQSLARFEVTARRLLDELTPERAPRASARRRESARRA
jgi:TetR/AcrR family transcriptional regulator, transcriptional repressor for nem operon